MFGEKVFFFLWIYFQYRLNDGEPFPRAQSANLVFRHPLILYSSNFIVQCYTDIRPLPSPGPVKRPKPPIQPQNFQSRLRINYQAKNSARRDANLILNTKYHRFIAKAPWIFFFFSLFIRIHSTVPSVCRTNSPNVPKKKTTKQYTFTDKNEIVSAIIFNGTKRNFHKNVAPAPGCSV